MFWTFHNPVYNLFLERQREYRLDLLVSRVLTMNFAIVIRSLFGSNLRNSSADFSSQFIIPLFIISLLTLCMIAPATSVYAHGGVAFEEDQCVINIGFLKAHFSVYQTESSSSEEYCEDIPDVGESIFVIDYLHDFLKEMPVDFRIIHDTTNLGPYAKWDDIVNLSDLEKDTVFIQTPLIQADGVFTSTFNFIEKGEYIGIVTARHPQSSVIYHAVFYFQVGGKNWGLLLTLLFFLLVSQAMYWYINKGLRDKKGGDND